MDKAAATLLGYTEEEIIEFFSPYIKIIAQERQQSFEDILQEIKYYYNGYRFSEKESKVYNPYSVSHYLFQKESKSIGLHWSSQLLYVFAANSIPLTRQS